MIKTGNPVISIYTEATPNPETMKFVVNKLLYPGKSVDFPEESEAGASPLAAELFTFPFIRGVFIASNFITLTKSVETGWEDVTPIIRSFLQDYLEEGRIIIDEEALTQNQSDHAEIQSDDSEIVKRIKEILDNYVKPAVEMDGGAIRFKRYTHGKLFVTLQGACSGCPSSMITLKAGIEAMMKRMVPEVREVEADAE